MEIIRLAPSHAKQYWQLRMKALKEHPEAFLTSYEESLQQSRPIEQTAERLSNENNYTFGAFENGELIGMVTLLRESRKKIRHRANIYAMYVNDSNQGRGIGKALLQEAIAVAKTLPELKKINLAVVSGNHQAKKLYETLGFSVYGVEKFALFVEGRYYDEEFMSLLL
ncbi:GNAT family N-acetyltransferase [Bacillus spongiae]|uniref:GNAT family N-acetyltransferase n=1 Tax=Bacillus spongiae TaxID=2683610 RepID=A0ABU8HFB7_9BACI